MDTSSMRGLRRVARAVEGEVEILDRLGVFELSAAQPQFELLGIAAFDFVMEEAKQKLLKRQAIVDGLAGAQGQGVQQPREPQFL